MLMENSRFAISIRLAVSNITKAGLFISAFLSIMTLESIPHLIVNIWGLSSNDFISLRSFEGLQVGLADTRSLDNKHTNDTDID